MPTLYVVATPIGNLSDMSPRAVETLKTCGLIAAEDTRVTMKLLNHFSIQVPITSYHQHNEKGKAGYLLDRMEDEGIDVALVTDAGTPAISDPGYILVEEAWVRGYRVVPVPGSSAAIAALSICGFDTAEFTFYGFLPRQKKALEEKLRQIAQGQSIAVVYESPHRVKELLASLTALYPKIPVVACCDLTKLYELTLRGTAEEVLAALHGNPKAEKGEYCLVMNFREVAFEEKAAVSVGLEARLFDQLLEGHSLKAAMATLIAEGQRKNAVYDASLRLKSFLSANREEE